MTEGIVRCSVLAALVLSVGIGWGCAGEVEDDGEPVDEGELTSVAAACPRVYADDFKGWPVAPVKEQHPVRGTFQEPRRAGQAAEGDGDPDKGYHNGIDISVRDGLPDPEAPPGRTHRVFALEGGEVWQADMPPESSCTPTVPLSKMTKPLPGCEGVVRVGHFGYGHVLPIVKKGDVVTAGQQIGWTTIGEWHLHLSEWCFVGGNRDKRVAVNPLDRRGKIAPYVDTAAPVVHEIIFRRPATPEWRPVNGPCAFFPEAGETLDAKHLSGIVDVRARIEDKASFQGFWEDRPELVNEVAPYRVNLTVIQNATKKVLLNRNVFRADTTFGKQLEELGIEPLDPSRHFAPGTREAMRALQALREPNPANRMWFRMFADPIVGPPAAIGAEGQYWDTRKVPNGEYLLKVNAWDIAGVRGALWVNVRVAN